VDVFGKKGFPSKKHLVIVATGIRSSFRGQDAKSQEVEIKTTERSTDGMVLIGLTEYSPETVKVKLPLKACILFLAEPPVE
jgi:hypothetical protein